jgi:hypothetical protein
MADLDFYSVLTRQRECRIISGSFAPAGTGAITDTRGVGFTAARTGVGVYEVTLEDEFPQAIIILASVQRSAAADGDVKVIGADAVSTTKKFTLTHMAAGVATEIAANAANRIHFMVVLRDTGVTP